MNRNLKEELKTKFREQVTNDVSDLVSAILEHFTKQDMHDPEHSSFVLMGAYHAILKSILDHQPDSAALLLKRNIDLVETSLEEMKQYLKTFKEKK